MDTQDRKKNLIKCGTDPWEWEFAVVYNLFCNCYYETAIDTYHKDY